MDRRRFGKSRLDLSDINTVVSPLGYRFSFYGQKDAWGTVAGWARPAAHEFCFERLILFLYGKEHDRVSVDLGVSLVPTGNNWRGMFEGTTFQHQQEQFFRVTTNDETSRFTGTVLPLVSNIHRSVSSQIAPKLYRATRQAIEAAHYCRSQMPRTIIDLRDYWSKQLLTANADTVSRSKSFPYWNVIGIPFASEAEEDRVILSYKIAVNAILLNATHESVANRIRSTTDIETCLELGWCIQILASQIHSPELWIW